MLVVPTSEPIDLRDSECKNVAVSRTDRITATGGTVGDIRLYDTRTGEQKLAIRNAHPSRLQCLEFNHCNKQKHKFFEFLFSCC